MLYSVVAMETHLFAKLLLSNVCCVFAYLMVCMPQYIYSHGRVKISSLLNRSLQELWDLTPIMILTVLFLKFASCCMYTITMYKFSPSTHQCFILLVYIKHYMFQPLWVILRCYRFFCIQLSNCNVHIYSLYTCSS
jgi:hypothetical protein